MRNTLITLTMSVASSLRMVPLAANSLSSTPRASQTCLSVTWLASNVPVRPRAGRLILKVEQQTLKLCVPWDRKIKWWACKFSGNF